jgi:hypothetical protein
MYGSLLVWMNKHVFAFSHSDWEGENTNEDAELPRILSSSETHVTAEKEETHQQLNTV